MVYEEREPERYYDWMLWKLRKSKKWQEMKKYSKEKKLLEKHKHSNAIMLDLRELTKCHYDLLKKYQKLYDENQSLKKQLYSDSSYGPEYRQKYHT